MILGAPFGACFLSGHHSFDSAKVLPILPLYSLTPETPILPLSGDDIVGASSAHDKELFTPKHSSGPLTSKLNFLIFIFLIFIVFSKKFLRKVATKKISANKIHLVNFVLGLSLPRMK